MKISQELTIVLSVEDLSLWMLALRNAAKTRELQFLSSWDQCEFYKQHGEVSRLTGLGTGAHEELTSTLREKWANR